jgi:ankyrin repeat protein
MKRDLDTNSTPLHKAAWSGDSLCINLLLEFGADVEAQDKDGGTPLFNAIYKDSASCMKTLLKHGANTKPVDSKGCLPLHVAAFAESLECTQFLVEEVEEVDINALNNDELSPFICAMQKNHVDVADFLMRAGAQIPVKNFGDAKEVEEIATKYRINPRTLWRLLTERLVILLNYFCNGFFRDEEITETIEEMTEEQLKHFETGIQLFNTTSPKKVK